jgi:hypothetical protein
MAVEEEVELDLTQSSRAGPGYKLEPYNPEPRRDYVRAIVTITLVVAFLGLLADACAASFASKDHWEQTKEMLQILMPALTGLLGSALGFYFGTKSGEGK